MKDISNLIIRERETITLHLYNKRFEIYRKIGSLVEIAKKINICDMIDEIQISRWKAFHLLSEKNIQWSLSIFYKIPDTGIITSRYKSTWYYLFEILRTIFCDT